MLTLDFAGCMADRVGEHGLDPSRIDPANEPAQGMAALTRRLRQSKGTGWERWRNLWIDPDRSAHVKAVKEVASRCRGRFDNLVVLGIGGSALGNIALQSALNPATYNLLPAGEGSGKRNGPRVFIIDNVDPVYFGAHLDFIRAIDPTLEKTLFNVVSKSGETAETAAQFMIIRDMLTKARGPSAAQNVVAITDPVQGTMRKICDDAGYTTLPVPDGVGGRFSALSPVGLFSAAMAGIDIDALLDGAASIEPACEREALAENPAAMLAFLLVELGTRKGKPNHVLMPYHNQLYLLADWFRQLWAESLGKRSDLDGDTVYAGFTPIKALGTTDQHSQVQLYREGPNDKVIGFITADTDPAHDVAIPAGLGVKSIEYLEGSTLGKLLHAEKLATEYALVESQRPHFTLHMPRIDAYHVGQFMALFMIATSYAGLMLNIDAYDQPAVELGKQATFGLMGRSGFEKFERAVAQTLTNSPYTIG